MHWARAHFPIALSKRLGEQQRGAGSCADGGPLWLVFVVFRLFYDEGYGLHGPGLHLLNLTAQGALAPN